MHQATNMLFVAWCATTTKALIWPHYMDKLIIQEVVEPHHMITNTIQAGSRMHAHQCVLYIQMQNVSAIRLATNRLMHGYLLVLWDSPRLFTMLLRPNSEYIP